MKTVKCTYKSNAYEYTLTVIFTDDIISYQQKYFKKWKVTEEADDCSGVCLLNPNSIEEYVIIYNYKFLTDNCVAHELVHLGCFILEDRNIGIKGEHQDYEPLCWIIGELTEVVRKMIQDKKIPIMVSKFTYGK